MPLVPAPVDNLPRQDTANATASGARIAAPGRASSKLVCAERRKAVTPFVPVRIMSSMKRREQHQTPPKHRGPRAMPHASRTVATGVECSFRQGRIGCVRWGLQSHTCESQRRLTKRRSHQARSAHAGSQGFGMSVVGPTRSDCFSRTQPSAAGSLQACHSVTGVGRRAVSVV